MKRLIKISANLITIFRIFLVFFMLPFLFLKEKIDNISDYFIFIFIMASTTDFLDGYIAKKFKQQTVFGKFFDPIADKLLVIVSFFYIYILCSVEPNNQLFPKNLVLITLLINIIRDFLIMGVRLMTFEQKTIISASFLGKLKTIFTFFSILFILLTKPLLTVLKIRAEEYHYLHSMISFILIINIFLIIFSGLNYIIKNFKFIKKNF